jgi:hypothetical protein
MNQNLVTNKHISQEVLDAMREAVAMPAPLTLTPYDAPYFFTRIDPTKRLRDQVFEGGPFAKHSVTDWRQVRVVEGPLREELQFLEGLGLATIIPMSGNTLYAVSPLAVDTLYKENREGVFININQNREVKARQFITLLITYVLPGMYWRNYYVTHGLAPDLHLTTHLGHEMLEIGVLWDSLVAKFGFPPA